MKMLMIICPERRQEDLRALIQKHGVEAYSELREVTGAGKTGKKLGTPVWPMRSTMIFTVVADDKKDELLKALAECAKTLYPDEGLRSFVLPVEASI